jgi:dephospho-CoA kinase
VGAVATRIGLTGGIGSGKSTVAALLQDLGAAVIDTDQIARELTGPDGKALEAIAADFGPRVIDARGALDRSRMRTIVFSDVSARRRLEAILHPLIAGETELQAASTTATVVIFDVPLLVESGRWPQLVDRVWVVDCTEKTQIERVMMRSGWERQIVLDVLAQQATRSQRRARADTVIYNDEIGLMELSEHVRQLWHSCALQSSSVGFARAS